MHKHETHRYSMRATRKAVERMVANSNTDPRARGAKTVLEGNRMMMICPDCNQAIVVVDVEFI